MSLFTMLSIPVKVTEHTDIPLLAQELISKASTYLKPQHRELLEEQLDLLKQATVNGEDSGQSCFFLLAVLAVNLFAGHKTKNSATLKQSETAKDGSTTSQVNFQVTFEFLMSTGCRHGFCYGLYNSLVLKK